MPSRADINPVEMKAFLPHLILLDVLDGPRFHIRLVGTHPTGAAGKEMTGKYLEEVDFGGQAAEVIGACTQCLVSRAPHYLRRTYKSTVKDGQIEAHQLVTPLSIDGETVNMLLIGVVIQPVR